MSSEEVQTVSSGLDKLKLVMVPVLVVAGVVGFYMLEPQGEWVRWAAMLGGLILAAIAFLLSSAGASFIDYAKASVNEGKKVVWPERQEAIQMTLYVFAFVIVMALFLLAVDKILEWFLYDLILGWRR